MGLALAGVSAPHARAQGALAPALVKKMVVVGGQQRSYAYYVSSKAENGFTPVVYALHDNGQSIEDFVRQSGWVKLAENGGFIVVFPDAVRGVWAPQSGGEDDYLEAVYSDVTRPPVRGEGGRQPPGEGGAARPAPPAGAAAPRLFTWLPFHYLTGAGAGARVAQAFAINHPGRYAALATLDGGPYNADYAKGEEPAQNGNQFMHPDKAGAPSWKQLKKDVPVAAWLFTTGAPTAAEARQVEYWKRADRVAPQAAMRNESGFQTAVYSNAANPDQQVRTTAAPASATYDEAMATVISGFFSHLARWTYSPNGDVGSLMTRDEVNKHFVVRPIDVNGQAYVYYLSVPPSYRKGQALPLVVSAHGGGFPAYMYLSQIKMHEVGEKEGFLTAYIQKVGNNGWNFQEPDGADAQFILKLIADAEANYSADPHRIYMQGFSIGSGLTYMMGVSHPKVFAAISPNSGIGGMSKAVEDKIAQNRAQGLRIPAMIIYGDVDTGGSPDGKIPAQGVLRVAIDEFKAINHITTPDRVVKYESDTTAPYDVMALGGKLVRTGADARYPAGRFEMYQYTSDDPKPLNLFNFVWVKDMAHAQDPREAQLQWDYLKHWRRNDDGSLTYVN
ncbi:MAG TPA: PHB depolymerase family esterase [Caulobacteraceae bacterium]|nr:PHB depolymerase family esterase [Caulobacteraceae bacterium]